MRPTNPKFTQEFILDREIKRVKSLLDHGLPKVYKGFDDYLYDFFPDFSWSRHCLVEYRWLLDNETWTSLAKQLQQKRGFDLVAEINAAIAEFESERS